MQDRGAPVAAAGHGCRRETQPDPGATHRDGVRAARHAERGRATHRDGVRAARHAEWGRATHRDGVRAAMSD